MISKSDSEVSPLTMRLTWTLSDEAPAISKTAIVSNSQLIPKPDRTATLGLVIGGHLLESLAMIVSS